MTNRQIISKIKSLIATEKIPYATAHGYTRGDIYYIVIDNLHWETAAEFAKRATGLKFKHEGHSMAALIAE